MRNLLGLIAVLALTSFCLAQDGSTGTLRGTVFDPTDHRVPRATIVLVNNATGFQYQQASDREGNFAFQLLPPGRYSARVTADGMSPQINPDLGVVVGGVTEV